MVRPVEANGVLVQQSDVHAQAFLAGVVVVLQSFQDSLKADANGNLAAILGVDVKIDVIYEQAVEGVGLDPILQMPDESLGDGALEVAVKPFDVDILADFPDVHPPLDVLGVSPQSFPFGLADLHHFPEALGVPILERPNLDYLHLFVLNLDQVEQLHLR